MGSTTPKQYLSLLDKPLISHTVGRLCGFEAFSKVFVAVASDDVFYTQIVELKHPAVRLVKGGEERCHSVFNALHELMKIADPDDWVLVHDVARPCVRISDIENLINRLQGHPVGGLLGAPVHDTMKRTSPDGRVEHSVPRELLWHAYTPQMFRLGMLHDALSAVFQNGLVVTDEAQAMEMAGYLPLMVEGAADNIKVTRPQDLPLAEFYIQQQNNDAVVTPQASGE